jgi:hypothetical protein
VSSAAAFTTIREYLEAQWTTTPLAWDNETFRQPNPANPAAFVLVQITGGLYEQMTIGAETRAANRWQEEGELLLSVMVPMGTGSLAARQIADGLFALFQGLQLDDIEFRDASIGLGVVAEDRGTWWVLPLRINWLRG